MREDALGKRFYLGIFARGYAGFLIGSVIAYVLFSAHLSIELMALNFAFLNGLIVSIILSMEFFLYRAVKKHLPDEAEDIARKYVQSRYGKAEDD